MERRRLRAIIPVSFVKSEETNFDEIYNSREYHKLVKSMDPEDVICMASLGGNQLVFVHGYVKVETPGESPWMVLFSQRIRIKRGKGLSDVFEPKMLANYARQAGIELVGLKLFEEYYKELMK